MTYMEINKAHWESDNDSFVLSMDFAKVNEEKRTVSGFATLDNIDSQNDLVTAEASLKAFSRARGNLREMHKKDSAVGTIVDFKEKTFTDANTGQVHRGIYVQARVSKGAQDTWEKVLDGTLSGFSIGGKVIDSEQDWNKDIGRNVNIIHDYELIELSLVDNPANQLANVFHIHKSADGSVTRIDGMVSEEVSLNVFLCKSDEITVESVSTENQDCPVCEKAMTNIGWVQDGEDRGEKVKELVKNSIAPSEGGEIVSKFTRLIKSKAVEEVPSEEEPVVVEETPVTEETPEELAPAPVEEIKDEKDEILKQMDVLHDAIEKALESNKEESRKQIEELDSKVEVLQKSLDDLRSNTEERFEEFTKGLSISKSKMESFEQRLEKHNSSTAIRKSGEYSARPEPRDDSDDPFGGVFFSANSLGD